MPRIAPTDVMEWSRLSKQWTMKHPGRNFSLIPFEERKVSKQARAAFWWSTKMEDVPNQPCAAACSACGRATHGWREGCYHRDAHEPNGEFLAICSACEDKKLTCELCQEGNITWEMGHEAFQQQSQHLNSQEGVIITSIDGEELEPTQLDLTAATGIPAEQLIGQLHSAFRGSSSSSA